MMSSNRSSTAKTAQATASAAEEPNLDASFSDQSSADLSDAVSHVRSVSLRNDLHKINKTISFLKNNSPEKNNKNTGKSTRELVKASHD